MWLRVCVSGDRVGAARRLLAMASCWLPTRRRGLVRETANSPPHAKQDRESVRTNRTRAHTHFTTTATLPCVCLASYTSHPPTQHHPPPDSNSKDFTQETRERNDDGGSRTRRRSRQAGGWRRRRGRAQPSGGRRRVSVARMQLQVCRRARAKNTRATHPPPLPLHRTRLAARRRTTAPPSWSASARPTASSWTRPSTTTTASWR